MKLRLFFAALLLLLAILVDFTSKILSVGADLALIGLAIYVAMPFLKFAFKAAKK